MVLDRTIRLDDGDIFKAIKEYIENHVDGVSGSEVCNFRIFFENEDSKYNPYITVQLEQKDV
ncbi:hypothetical protein [Rhizobium phage RHph_X2_28B]|uniref:hypothetical protein n=1 Tax=Rhizobium phage RHph_X2_28B TaxID=2836086 RepID=UPI00232933B2|nr:hypothetical protein PP751_gp021 [Rhizobium phage RHph_X2_28B]QWY83473.1 hypothetical protein [Rhizobium phage RHph_X2_28B]QWY83709.1 hypothetical protein [Rhizobium phage RHph_X3_15]